MDQRGGRVVELVGVVDEHEEPLVSGLAEHRRGGLTEGVGLALVAAKRRGEKRSERAVGNRRRGPVRAHHRGRPPTVLGQRQALGRESGLTHPGRAGEEDAARAEVHRVGDVGELGGTADERPRDRHGHASVASGGPGWSPGRSRRPPAVAAATLRGPSHWWPRLDMRRTVPFSLAVVIVLGVSAGAVWASGIWKAGGSTHPAGRHRVPTSRPLVAAPVSTCRSPLTPDAPLRLWIGGDSLAGSLGPALGTLAANTGIVQPVFDSRVSSGLTTPGFFDWPAHATQEMARLDPEVVVFIIDTNDSELVTGSANAADAKARYAELVTQMLDILGGAGSHRYVYWVGGPTILDSTIDSGVRQLDDVARSVVVNRPNTTYVDAYRLFGDSQGHFTFTLPDASGKPVLVRSDDGVHFTPAGADRLAQPIFQALDPQCHLQSQAVPGSPKTVIETPGSTQVGSGQGSTPPGRPPATAPPPPTTPPTAPPTTPAPVITVPRVGPTRT